VTAVTTEWPPLEALVGDIRAVLDALAIAKAHIVGISMGGFAVLHFGLAYPDRASSLVVAGCGHGAQPDKRQPFAEEVARTAAQIETRGMAEVCLLYPSAAADEP